MGRIMRARKPSSTSFSFLVGGWSLAACLGGGPRLGRDRLMVEFCLLRVLVPAVLVVATVDVLVLLGARPWFSVAVRRLPLVREVVRAGFSLETDAAVCVVKLGGSLTGRVGDLTLGLTNPVPEGGGWRGGGLLTDDDRVEELPAGPAESVFWGCRGALSGVLLANFGADASRGLLGALLTVGDFAGFPTDLEAGAAEMGLSDAAAVAILVTGFDTSAFSATGSLFLPVVPFNDAFVSTSGVGAAGGVGVVSILGFVAGSDTVGLVAGLSAPSGLSVPKGLSVPSGLSIPSGLSVPAGLSNPGTLNFRGVVAATSLLAGERDARAAWKLFSVRGDSAIGWSWSVILGAARPMASAKTLRVSDPCLEEGVGLAMLDSPLILRVPETFDSWLGSRCRPILPSFSMAIKLVRTLERGRGDSPSTELPLPMAS